MCGTQYCTTHNKKNSELDIKSKYNKYFVQKSKLIQTNYVFYNLTKIIVKKFNSDIDMVRSVQNCHHW